MIENLSEDEIIRQAHDFYDVKCYGIVKYFTEVGSLGASKGSKVDQPALKDRLRWKINQ